MALARWLPSGSRLGAGRTAERPRAALFLDRDGVLVEDVHYLTSPERLRILPDTLEPLRVLQPHCLLIVATNQSGVARGLLSEAGLERIHRVMVARFEAAGVRLDAIYHCPHH